MKQFVAVSLIYTAELIKWELYMTLAVVRSVIHNNNEWRTLRFLPRKTDETVRCPIAVPSRGTIE